MPKWIALDPKKHKDSGWLRNQTVEFAAQDATVPVLYAELHMVLPHYPLAFIKGQNSDYSLVGIQSLQPGQNVFTDNLGRWRITYMPAFYRSYPFQFSVTEDGQMILCYDEESNLLLPMSADSELQPLFIDETTPSPALQPVLNFLQACQTDGVLTQKLIALLAAQNLIHPWPVALHEKNVDGLFKIDEEALTRLSGDVLHELTSSGALKLAYAQIFSQARLEDVKNRMAGTTPDFTAFGVPDTPSLVIDQESDMIKFN